MDRLPGRLPGRRDQGLRDDLPAKEMVSHLAGTVPAIEVVSHFLEIQNFEQIGKRGVHGRAFYRRRGQNAAWKEERYPGQMARFDTNPMQLRPSRIDHLLEEAQQRGLFEDLEGQGEPLRDLAEVANPSWWGQKLLRRERVSLLPPSLAIRSKAEKVLASLPDKNSEEEVRSQLEILNQEIREVNAQTLTGPATHLALLDIEAHVRRWQLERETQEPS